MSVPAPLFHKGETVVLSTTRELGRIEADPDRRQGDYWYRVHFGKRGAEKVIEEDLEALLEAHDTIQDLAKHGSWGKIQAFRCALAVERMTRENRGTIYSYKAQRILFEPHQYKPLLKLLDSTDRRLLIADEVGLGKTIEAGLILTELEARKAVDKVLIVCPPRLRDKWREELTRKFDQPFEIYTKASFDQYLTRAVDNPRKGHLRAVVSLNTLRSESIRERLTGELGHLDMVIFDEAHHARNPSTLNAELLKDLCGITECVVLLTATPIQLRSRDLFTLLEALRPTEFRDPNYFETQLKLFRGVHDSSRLVRTQNPKKLDEAAQYLERIFMNKFLFQESDPLAVQLIEDLRGTVPVDRRAWVELERRVQELHPLATILTRSRKRDVQSHAPLRRANVFKCQWTEQESQTYDRLLNVSASTGWFDRTYNFGTIQRARQAASCLPAAIESRAAAAAKDEEAAIELTDILPQSLARENEEDNNQPDWGQFVWEGPDSKFEKLNTILQGIWKEEPVTKVIIFTFFVGSSRYLVKRLAEQGIKTVRIAGDVPSNPNDRQRDERGKCLQQFKDDPNVRVLVSTEVGSEGLDFQFCHHLVNYDLPWNPMVVEQRIGRIDRFGQKADVVYIHNLVVEGTVEDRILQRLYDRIGIFRESIGDLEDILGETMSELQRDYLSGMLTPAEAERRVEEAAQAINRRKMNLEQLEKNAGELFGHEEYIRDELNRVGRLGRYLTEQSLIAVLRTFLETNHPGIGPWDHAPGIYGLRLTTELRQEIQETARQSGGYWFSPPETEHMLFATEGDIAFRSQDVTLLNVNHPLMKLAVKQVKKQLEGPHARLGQSYLRIKERDGEGIQPGIYYLAVFQEIVEGIRPRCMIETVVWSEVSQALLEPELGERLLHLVLEHGEEWQEEEGAAPLPSEAWAMIDEECHQRCGKLRDNETRENDALYHRRKRAIVAEYEQQRQVKEQRLKTAEAKNKLRMLPAFRGQLEKHEAIYRARLAELELARKVSVRLSDPLAVCTVKVKSM